VVTLSGTVAHASTCQLQLLSAQSFPVVYSHNARSCIGGTFSAQVTIGPNPTAVTRTVAFALVASNGMTSASALVRVQLVAAPPATVTQVNASSSELGPRGGVVTVSGTVAHATTCQLQLLSAQSFPVVYSHNARSCTGGTFSAQVTIGPNPSAVTRTVAFALVASNGSASTKSDFRVMLSAGAASNTTGTVTAGAVPATTTTQPVPSASLPATASQSSNWAGYAAVGGPYTVAKGTFTVPSLSAGGFYREQASEWVGLDGLNTNDPSLVQAGVEEYPNPDGSGTVSIEPWWEILPAPPNDISIMSVSAGDEVTVTIWKVSGTTWEINLTDNTTGQAYTTPPEQYTGPGSSAEWVVEAATECTFRCHTAVLAPYSPPVAFSGIGMTGPNPTSLQEITMVQGPGSVAVPSAIASDGFTVAHTGNTTAF
jgi:hypothetical protein